MNINVFLLIFSVPLIIGSILWKRRIDAHISKDKPINKPLKRLRLISALLTIAGGYVFITRLLVIIFGQHEREELAFSIWQSRVDIFGYSLSLTVVYTWIAMAILIILALIIRFTVFKAPKDKPSGVQNVVEFIVQAVSDYTEAQTHGAGEMLASYILTIASLMITSAFLELFRIRPPMTDISMTFALALMTFVLINIYGIRKKGVIGRIKSLSSPTPIVFPFRIISDMAIPVSMACRLFGNMLGGLIIIDLLYTALGSGAIFFPSVAGLYFNAFHPMIQAFIFVTLTLTFINEAVE